MIQKTLKAKNWLATSLVLFGSTIALGCSNSVVNKNLDRVDPETSEVQLLSSTTEPSQQTLDSRTSFLLASNLINQQQGQQALQELENLENQYPILASYVLLKQGQAYQLAGNNNEAETSWQQVVNNYPDSAAAAEALYLLGKSNPAYWQQAIKRFPAHPRTHQIVRQLLEQNPNQLRLMALLAKYTPDDEEVGKMRDRLMNEYASQLTPQDWQAIADGYWLKWDYGKAGRAYAKSSLTPGNLYRAARGHHLGNDIATAKKLYLQLIEQFPNAEDTGLGLRRLATIVDKQQAIIYLDRAIAKFPQEAPEALMEKADLLDTLNSSISATQARKLVLTQYTNSEAAAEYRWEIANIQAKAGNLTAAWHWAQQIAVNNPESPLAPKATFWIGKWAQKLGKISEATTAFKAVLANFPRSYYAWRAAVALNWDVGDFTTVRQKLPEVVKQSDRAPLPAGSEIVRELDRLGLKSEALAQFQIETAYKKELTIAEEFTSGLLKLDQGKNLRGINQIWFLKDRNKPSEKQQWQALRQTAQYWQGLYPFPFEKSILNWSQSRQLNPLLVTALIRQESRFEPKIRSWAGATGLMQVMPATGEHVASSIGLSDYSLTNPEDNINIGTYYLDFTHQKYQNNSMLAVASYNAGPNAVAQWVSRYGLKDADEFVEQIPYSETKGYVESVFENYWNYLLIYNPEVEKLFQQLS
ncbi:transglycosylase SLT domain-containing protein [Myxosarcina sp. GI1]|uniref:transglycosylase SLT domain-containing protein n=1 Tax=Myxosarcina sp. GI1 TaxID=1541065 RepID=UPI000AEFDDCC|nr:transglycosylase SLT domain-containing protein [Myxosarcina sp. GI1]